MGDVIWFKNMYKNTKGVSVEQQKLIEFNSQTQYLLKGYKKIFSELFGNDVEDLTILYLQEDGNWIGSNLSGDIDILLQKKSRYDFSIPYNGGNIKFVENIFIFKKRSWDKKHKKFVCTVLEIELGKLNNQILVDFGILSWLKERLLIDIADFISPKQLLGNLNTLHKTTYNQVCKQTEANRIKNITILQLLELISPDSAKFIIYFRNATKLTLRERECFHLYSQGFSSKEIGEQLDISPHTVEKYKYNYGCKIWCGQLYEKKKNRECERMLMAFGEI